MPLKLIKNFLLATIFELISVTYYYGKNFKKDWLYIKNLKENIKNTRIKKDTPPQSKKICLLVIYQPKEIPNHIITQLLWIKKLGFSIHLISNTPLSEESCKLLEPLSFKISVRPNIGYDFGAYQYGILDFLEKYRKNSNRLMIMNDSIFFPLFDPTEAYKKVDDRRNDFWSWTENWEIHYHLTSYAMVFKPKAFNSKAFNLFWKKYKPYSNRKHAINNGEVKLTKKLIDELLIPDAAIRCTDIIEGLNKTSIEQLKKSTKLISGSTKKPSSCCKQDMIDIISEVIDTKNSSHQGAIIINNIAKSPILKKDLVYKHIYPNGKLMSNIESDEKTGISLEEIESFYRTRGRLNQKGNFLKRILASRGYH